MQSCYLDRNYPILVLPRRYSSDIYQAGATPGIGSFRCGQGAPPRPDSLLLDNDKERPGRPDSRHTSSLFWQCKREHRVGWFWGCQGGGRLHPHSGG